jgi:hypothetical protein
MSGRKSYLVFGTCSIFCYFIIFGWTPDIDVYTAASFSGNVEVLKKSHELNHRCIIHDGTQPLKHQISVAYGQVIFYKEFLTMFGLTYNHY